MLSTRILTIAAVLPLLVFAGCVNPYRTNFNSTGDRFPSTFETRLSSKNSNPRIQQTEDITGENWRMFENGYVMIGFSKFDGPNVELALAKQQASAIGADVILVQKKYSKTLTETVTVTQWPSNETTDIREDAVISGRGGSRTESRRVEVTTSRSPETIYVPKQVDYFEHSATYWRRLERPLFGAFVQDMSDDQKAKLQTNRGLVVRALMKDSPAHAADLLKGDIITKVDGATVPSAQRFYEELAVKAGKEVELSLLRGNTTLKKRVSLGS